MGVLLAHDAQLDTHDMVKPSRCFLLPGQRACRTLQRSHSTQVCQVVTHDKV